jgi:hypothetical protein
LYSSLSSCLSCSCCGECDKLLAPMLLAKHVFRETCYGELPVDGA